MRCVFRSPCQRLIAVGIGLFVMPLGLAQQKTPDLKTSVIERLQSGPSKWTLRAAESYWRVNRRRLEITADVDLSLLDRELKGLERLPHSARIMQLVEAHPETANLCTLAGKPAALAAALMDLNVADRAALITTFTVLTNGSDIDNWTQALARHGRIIAHLIRKCPALPVYGLFTYEEALKLPEAQKIYARWLDEVLTPRLLDSDDELASRLDFVGCVGPGLRDRLVGSNGAAFRAQFENFLWPRCRDTLRDYTQQTNHGSPWYVIGRWEFLWDFFQRDDAHELLLRGGSDAFLLLSGPDAIHPDLQPLTASLLKKGCVDLPNRMLRFSSNAGFVVLASNLSGDLALLNGLVNYLENSPNWAGEISDLRGLSRDGAIKRGITPVEPSIIPGVSLFRLVEKGLDGRKIHGGDWVSAGFDIVDLATLGASIEITAVGKASRLAGASRTIIKQTLRTGTRESLEKLAQRGIKELAKGETTEGSQYLVKQSLQLLPAEIREKLIKAALVDISGPVKQGFKLAKSLGFGNESYKRLTGLEARLFARKDGRVFVSLPGAVTSKNPALRFLWITADNGTLNSDLLQNGMQSGAAAVTQEYLALQTNLAAWWAATATGQLTTP